MEKVIGGVMGLAAFAAVVGVSLVKGVSFGDCILRAVLALGLGYLVGWLIFGRVGLAIAKEAAGQVEAPPEAAPEAKPAASAPQAPPSKSPESR